VDARQPGVQVAPEHYDFERYDDRERWMSYWHQIRAALALRPRRVLEIGSGSGVFRSYLQGAGVEVKVADVDPSRRPDYVVDVRRLDEVLPPGERFDVVCAFQVLEHLPFEDFEAALAALAKRAAPYVLLSLPYRGVRLRLSLWLGDWKVTLGNKLLMPWRYRPCPEHHWELGRGHSARRITKILARHFEVVGRGFVEENPYHYMWTLKARV
jgi:2-polyprenyl-3-methyl-5-hydroxy-6-metoxy-1,4-benzoquinol methylase